MKFFRKHQKKLIAILALLLALTMILPAITMILGSADAVTQSEIDSLKDDAAALAQEKKELSSKLAALEGEIDSAYSKKLVVEQEINVVQEQISVTEALIAKFDKQIAECEEQIAECEEQIAQAEIELVEAQEEEAKHYEEFCQRVRAMEEEGTVSYWHILFNAASFTDLLDKAVMISEVVEYDNAVMDALEQAREEVENAKAELENAKVEKESAKADLESARTEQLSAKSSLDAQKSELSVKRTTITSLLSEMQTKQDVYESKIEHLEKEFDEVENEIARKQKELQAQIDAGKIQINTGSGYVWPLDGCYVITSLTGGRIHPKTGLPNNHLGIDIRANYGTSIKAARGGVVIISTYHWSYGNYVVVDHGNGDTTLYAHMSSRSVSVGQTVTQGQELGKVGSTGSSTGNHLHFEVKVGGVRQDPVNYYPNLNLWVTYNGQVVPLPH